MCRQMQWNEKEVKDGPKQMCMDVYCSTMEPSSVSLNEILFSTERASLTCLIVPV